jgi:SOS response regulatory protein OraA/RecX
MSGVDPVLEHAFRVLRQRDRSVRELDDRLRLKGFSGPECEQAIATLLRTGLLDDRRFAEARAVSLAERGAGDALIRHRLGSAGVAAEIVDDALLAVPPEAERARLVVSRRGAGAATARYLAAQGFSEDVLDGLLAG